MRGMSKTPMHKPRHDYHNSCIGLTKGKKYVMLTTCLGTSHIKMALLFFGAFRYVT